MRAPPPHPVNKTPGRQATSRLSARDDACKLLINMRPRSLCLLPTLAAAAYTPPGVLSALVDAKRAEVERMSKLPENREDGPWFLRLAYPAASASYGVGRAIGWKREAAVVFADVKRASPTGALGSTATIDPRLDVEAALADAARLGCAGALVCSDIESYGCSYRDLRAACTFARARAPPNAADDDERVLPIVAKDLIIDPLQIARAACEGAKAVLLIAAACLPDLPALLDTCTLLGVEAVVEVHTPDELTVASECGASLILVNERDRATGELVVGQAAAMAPLLPPDCQCLAGGGISRIDQVRTLRRAGYDGFVLGRALFGGDPNDADALMTAIFEEPKLQRVSEPISVPKRSSSKRYEDDPTWEKL